MACRHWSPVAVRARGSPRRPLLGLHAEQLAGRVAGGGLGAAPVGPADALHQPGAVAGLRPRGRPGCRPGRPGRTGPGAGLLPGAGGCRRAPVGRPPAGACGPQAQGAAWPQPSSGTADALDQALALGPPGWVCPASGPDLPGLHHLLGGHGGAVADDDHGAVVQAMDAVPHGPREPLLVAHGAAGLWDPRATGCRRAGSRTRPRQGRRQRAGSQGRRGAGGAAAGIDGRKVFMAAMTCMASEPPGARTRRGGAWGKKSTRFPAWALRECRGPCHPGECPQFQLCEGSRPAPKPRC